MVGTKEYGINYGRDLNDSLHDAKIVVNEFCDSDWASVLEHRKSTSGFVFTIAGGAVAWASKRQPVIALSTAEAEYVAACEATMEAMAERKIIREVLSRFSLDIRIGIDSQSTFVMATSPTHSRRTRHIELRWHYVRASAAKHVAAGEGAR